MPSPRATYRIQLRSGFGFDDVAALSDYLEDLGVSHLYASPYLQAVPGSSHGYDVIDHGQLSAELGGEIGHARMCRALAARGLGQLLDVVPNHMAIGTSDNEWWREVLEDGPSSAFAGYFDVDWSGGAGDDRIVLPILGERYADALASGLVTVVRDGARFTVHYRDHRLPVAPRSLGEPLRRVAERIGSPELGFLADAFVDLPAATATDRASTTRRRRDKQVIRGLLERLCAERPTLAAAIDDELAAVGRRIDTLDALLERQNWRLGYWRNAMHELSYRRFFDVMSLVGLRIEDPVVFDAVHARVLGWLADGSVDGVRIDHIDGLRDPAGYLERLRQRAPQAWIVVEKILAADEAVPASWPIDGTTGYEFGRLVDGVFVDPAAEPALEAVAARFDADPTPWRDQARQARLDVIEQLLSRERDRLVELAMAVIAPHPELRDVTRGELRDAITELLASYPVYRTYVGPAAPISDDDRARIAGAIETAASRRPEIGRRLWATLEAALRLEPAQPAELELAMHLQQVTGAVMAKGIEDTLFYRDPCFVALNEVGGAPERFGVGLDELHAALGATRWPRTLLATTTHDSKRGEDVRARLAVLSEIPDTWAAAVERWSARAERHRSGGLPDRALEYLAWQTLVGAWPLDVERATEYLLKAAREAKRGTSWLRPDRGYEAAVTRFVAGVLGDRELIADLEQLVALITAAGRRNSLARTLIKLTAPGVPDLYQGSELWDLALVDPDNRRPVDFERRRALLRRARDLGPAEAMAGSDAGLPKLWLIQRVLHARRRHPDWFEAPHARLAVRGAGADRVIAYRRGARLMVVAPRFTARGGDWGDTQLVVEAVTWIDLLSGETVEAPTGALAVARACARFPVALLARRG